MEIFTQQDAPTEQASQEETMQKFRLIATAASGIEALVGRELRDLGYQVQTENGRVRFNGTIKDILRTNLWLRTADRIKIIVGEFDAYTFDELFEKTLALPWDQLLPMDAEFPVEGKSRNSETPQCSRRAIYRQKGDR